MKEYWDTSCVIKLYCEEENSEFYLDKLAAQSGPLWSSVLLTSELMFALHQKEMRGEIPPGSAIVIDEKFQADAAAGRFLLLPFGEDIRRECRRIAAMCYGHAPPIPLRTLDGLHLASAYVAGCRRILTTDTRMRKAAQLLGLKLAPLARLRPDILSQDVNVQELP